MHRISDFYADPVRRSSLLLWLISLHSFIVGICMLAIPPEFLPRLGYQELTERFFIVQGGVFHLVMSMAYAAAARDVVAQKGLIRFTISAKVVALCFLLIYYFAIDPILVILLSGIGDGIMALLVYGSTRQLNQSDNE